MIIATRKCGCPPKSGTLSTSTEECPQSPCCRSKRLARFTSTPPFSALEVDDCTDAISKNKTTHKKSHVSNKDHDSSCPKTQDSERFSEIAGKDLPYKEIEAVINETRLVVRTQKEESIQEEYDPPCDCVDQNKGLGRTAVKESTSRLRRGNDVVYQMTDTSKFGGERPKQATLVKRACDQSDDGENRTITLYPYPGVTRDSGGGQPIGSGKDEEKRDRKDKSDKTRSLTGSIDLEENPNIFVLRIRRKCDNSDKKYNMDLELRAPRPWSKDMREKLFRRK